MIIDSHTHVDEVAALGWFDPPEVLLPLLDEADIDQAVIMSYRDATGPDDPATAYILDAIARYPNRLIGYVRLNAEAPNALAALDHVGVRVDNHTVLCNFQNTLLSAPARNKGSEP